VFLIMGHLQASTSGVALTILLSTLLSTTSLLPALTTSSVDKRYYYKSN